MAAQMESAIGQRFWAERKLLDAVERASTPAFGMAGCGWGTK